METKVINTVWRPLYGKLVTGLNLLTPEWQSLNKLTNFENFSLRQIIWPVDLYFGGGMVKTVDGGSPARPVSNAPVEATDTWKHLARRFEVSYDVFTLDNDERTQKAAIVKQLTYQTKDALKAFRKAIAIDMYGSSTAVLAKINSAAGAPTYTLKDRYGVSGLAVDISWFQVNKDKVSIMNPTGPTSRGIELVTASSRSGLSITLAASISGAAANDLVVFANHLNGTDTDYGRAMNGLLDVGRGASLHGLATADHPDWAAGVDVANLGAALSGEKLMLYFTLAEQASDYAPNFAWTTAGVIAAAGGPELDQRRYGADEDTMRLGFKKLNVMGVKAEARPFCPPGYFFSGSTKALRKLAPDSAAKEVSTGGPQDFVYGGTYIGYFKDFVFRPQLTAISRKALIVVSGVTESSV